MHLVKVALGETFILILFHVNHRKRYISRYASVDDIGSADDIGSSCGSRI